MAWAAYGIFSAWVDHVQLAGSPRQITWGTALLYDGAAAFLMGIFSPVVAWVADRFRPERPHLRRNLAIHFAGALIYSTITKLLWEMFARYTGYRSFGLDLPRLLKSINWSMAEGVPLYVLIVFVCYAFDYYRRYQRGLVNAADLNAQLAHAQLQSLKMQLHPHFLFNTLHAISELIHEDPLAAERMIVGLAQLLRLSLDTSSAIEVPLEQELHFTRLYLDLEKMRFDDRLQVTFDINPELMDAMVPNLICSLWSRTPSSTEYRSVPAWRDPDHGRAGRGIDGDARQRQRSGPGPKPDGVTEGIGHGTTRAPAPEAICAEQTFQFRRQCGLGRGSGSALSIELNIDAEGDTHAFAQSADR